MQKVVEKSIRRTGRLLSLATPPAVPQTCGDSISSPIIIPEDQLAAEITNEQDTSNFVQGNPTPFLPSMLNELSPQLKSVSLNKLKLKKKDSAKKVQRLPVTDGSKRRLATPPHSSRQNAHGDDLTPTLDCRPSEAFHSAITDSTKNSPHPSKGMVGVACVTSTSSEMNSGRQRKSGFRSGTGIGEKTPSTGKNAGGKLKMNDTPPLLVGGTPRQFGDRKRLTSKETKRNLLQSYDKTGDRALRPLLVSKSPSARNCSEINKPVATVESVSSPAAVDADGSLSVNSCLSGRRHKTGSLSLKRGKSNTLFSCRTQHGNLTKNTENSSGPSPKIPLVRDTPAYEGAETTAHQTHNAGTLSPDVVAEAHDMETEAFNMKPLSWDVEMLLPDTKGVVKTEAPAVEADAPDVETLSHDVEADAHDVETSHDMETEAPDVKTLTHGVEMEAPDVEALSHDVKANTPDAEKLSHDMETDASDVETSHDVESDALDVETLSHDVETEPPDVETLSDDVEAEVPDVKALSPEVQADVPDMKSLFDDEGKVDLKKSPLRSKISRLVNQNISSDNSSEQQQHTTRQVDNIGSQVFPSRRETAKDALSSASNNNLKTDLCQVSLPCEDTSTATYSRPILESINHYLSQVAEAQSRVMYRVKWGPPITASTKQCQGCLMSRKPSPQPVCGPNVIFLRPSTAYPDFQPISNHSVHVSGSDSVPLSSQGVGQSLDGNSDSDEEENGGEKIDETLMPYSSDEGDSDGVEEFISLNSVEEESEDNVWCGAPLLPGGEKTLCATMQEPQMDESMEKKNLMDSGAEMLGQLGDHTRPVKETDNFFSGTVEFPVQRYTVTQNISPRTTPTAIKEPAGDHSLLSSLERRQVSAISSKKSLPKWHRPQISDSNDTTSGQISDEDSYWMHSRKHIKVTVSALKRASASQKLISASRGEDVVKAEQSPCVVKQDSAAARLQCRGKGTHIHKDPLTFESEVRLPEKVGGGCREYQTLLKGRRRTLIDSSDDSDGENDILCLSSSDLPVTRKVAPQNTNSIWYGNV